MSPDDARFALNDGPFWLLFFSVLPGTGVLFVISQPILVYYVRYNDQLRSRTPRPEPLKRQMTPLAVCSVNPHLLTRTTQGFSKGNSTSAASTGEDKGETGNPNRRYAGDRRVKTTFQLYLTTIFWINQI
eukprot:gb/GECG01015701.1/.p1 GENE.gb/GECG01015701.1/~~gb/GECG01015701.1/.p1  ORF type:complete len:130 (+),score=6.86 gb/GECG01015701.1/:1-390(+)